ncbi:hypothetical protein ACJMK2_020207 [Sinanodonta woodiana]|uniref:FAM124 domain-containing protein n=1 Tax=Sinanodonta woodiana TaxID=1069815 RepID=A0ABD3TYD3_SINWO
MNVASHRKSITLESKDPFKCTLTLVAPCEKGLLLKRIVSPLISWIDPLFQIIKVEEQNDIIDLEERVRIQQGRLRPCEKDTFMLPSLSVMLFVNENGVMCAKHLEQNFHLRPWLFSHRVDLRSTRSPSTVVAKQEFYKLSDDLPLWAVCPIHCGNEHLRINMFVRNFSSMVEFYRTVTDTEIETNKQGFCIFQLYSQSGLDFQLSLKHSPHLNPQYVKSAFLTFHIPDIEVIKTTSNANLTEIQENLYCVLDPDGNPILLRETSPRVRRKATPKIQVTRKECTELWEDMKSQQSYSDSHDSGRCSDMETCFSEFDTNRGEIMHTRCSKCTSVHSKDIEKSNLNTNGKSFIPQEAYTYHCDGPGNCLPKLNSPEEDTQHCHKREVKKEYFHPVYI